jgi:hypothetical protein
MARGDAGAQQCGYLRSGEYEIDHPEWPGQNIVERSTNGHDDLLRALVAELKRRSNDRMHAPVPHLDLPSWTRRKLRPMVHGFFPEDEREMVLRLFEKSVIFLTSANIEAVLLGQRWLRSAWDLANLYLSSVDADLLSPDAPSLLGLSQETTCYVSTEYFVERGRIEDFVIHEAAHVFHNCKRRTAGFPQTRTKEWLLQLEFMKRETFAYSCEAYGWIVEHASNKADRLSLAKRFAAHGFGQCDETMDPSEVVDIVQEACHARNGWKVILGRCAPEKRSTRRAVGLAGIPE